MFVPMLAGKCESLDAVRYPVLASPKLDGIRATVQENQLISRSLKALPNVNVQNLFANLPYALDGELIVGDPTALDAFRKTESLVMSDCDPIPEEGITYHLFDHFNPDPFNLRILYVKDMAKRFAERGIPLQYVWHTYIHNKEELIRFEDATVEAGYEGVMLRDPEGPYKQEYNPKTGGYVSRSTALEGYLVKLKRFEDGEAIVIGYVELMHNANTAKRNALGHLQRSTAKAGKIGLGMLGAWEVRDIKTGVEFEVGTGYTKPMRKEFWKNPGSYLGRIMRYRFFPSGSKIKPRFPVFDSWRDPRDMS